MKVKINREFDIVVDPKENELQIRARNDKGLNMILVSITDNGFMKIYSNHCYNLNINLQDDERG